MTSTADLLRHHWDVVKEDWRLVAWVSLVLLVGGIGMTVLLLLLSVPLPVLGLFLMEGPTRILGMVVMGVGIVVGVALALLLQGVLEGVLRSGLIGVLSVREKGMTTEWSIFWQHAMVGWKKQVRLHLLGALILTPLALVAIGAFFLPVMAAGGFGGSEEEVLFALFVGLGIFFLVLLLALPVTIALAMAIRYGAYVLQVSPNETAWGALKKGAKLLKKQPKRILGLAALFFLVSMAASFVLQLLVMPLSFLAIIPVIGVIINMLLSAFVWVVSVAITSGVRVWEEAASWQLFQEQQEEV